MSAPDVVAPAGDGTRVAVTPRTSTPPRLGFLGVGWIGRHRLEALAGDGRATIAAVADPSAEARAAVLRTVPGAAALDGLDALLDLPLDGVVIATPSALHAEQSIRCLEAGLHVFCQKPVGRSAAEVRAVVDAARRADRALGVDLCYRRTRAMERIRALVAEGEIGRVHAADLVFHNAYGPDRPWFYRRGESGGGCLLDLGIHLVDLALWTLDATDARVEHAWLGRGGAPLEPGEDDVEDYAVCTLRTADGAVVRVACSWNLQAGRDAVIEAAFYGSAGGAALRNVDGSFHDFVAERFRGTACEPLEAPPDPWGGRTLVDWTRRIAAGDRFDPESERIVTVARLLDEAYRGGRGGVDAG